MALPFRGLIHQSHYKVKPHGFLLRLLFPQVSFLIRDQMFFPLGVIEFISHHTNPYVFFWRFRITYF